MCGLQLDFLIYAAIPNQSKTGVPLLNLYVAGELSVKNVS